MSTTSTTDSAIGAKAAVVAHRAAVEAEVHRERLDRLERLLCDLVAREPDAWLATVRVVHFCRAHGEQLSPVAVDGLIAALGGARCVSGVAA